MKHLKFLDGLRGLMALNVILCHFVCVYYPQMYIANWGDIKGCEQWLSVFSNTPLNALINGDIAVQFFFILSGFLAALTIFSNKDSSNLAERAFKRYLRLLPMIAIATIFAWLLMVTGLMTHFDITNCDGVNGSFLLEYNNFKPTIKNLLFNIFIRPFIANSQYVGPFWYIKPDFWGYLFSLLLVILTKNYKWRRIAYLIILPVTLLNYTFLNFSAFVLGTILADLYFYKETKTTYFSKYYTFIYHHYFNIACIIIGSYLAMIPIYMSSNDWYPFIHNNLGSTFVRAFGLTLSMWGILNWKSICIVLENKVLLWMGKISFATYAFHWPIMLSLEAYLFSKLIVKYSYNTSALLAFIITIPVIYIVSFLITKYLIKYLNLIKLYKQFKSRVLY